MPLITFYLKQLLHLRGWEEDAIASSDITKGAVFISDKLPLSVRAKQSTSGRGFAPLLPTLPLPLIREGGQGDRLLNDLNSGSWAKASIDRVFSVAYNSVK